MYPLKPQDKEQYVAQLRSSLPRSLVTELYRQLNEQLYEQSGQSLKNYKAYVVPPEAFKRDLELASREIESISDQELRAATFFIEKGRVFIDVDGYYLSCAAGSFHPAEIPASLITLPSIRNDIAGY